MHKYEFIKSCWEVIESPTDGDVLNIIKLLKHQPKISLF